MTNNQNKPNLNISETKLKPLQPTLRDKKRFIRTKIIADKKYDFKDLSNNLSNQILYFLGAIDYGNAGIWFIKDEFDFENQEILIRTSNKFKDKTIASILLIDKFDKDRIKVEILKVSGTIKGTKPKQ